MNIPLTEEDYKNIYNEIYEIKENKITFRYAIEIDLNNLNLSQIISDLIQTKNRLVILLNMALKNKTYYQTKKAKIDIIFDYILNKTKMEDTETKMTVEQKKAYATNKAYEILSERIFNGENAPQKLMELEEQVNKADVLYNEIKNLYSNLNDIIIALGIMAKTNNTELKIL